MHLRCYSPSHVRGIARHGPRMMRVVPLTRQRCQLICHKASPTPLLCALGLAVSAMTADATMPARRASPSHAAPAAHWGPESRLDSRAFSRVAPGFGMGRSRVRRAIGRPTPGRAPDSRHALPVHAARQPRGLAAPGNRTQTAAAGRPRAVALADPLAPQRTGARHHRSRRLRCRQGGVRKHPGTLRDRQFVPTEGQARTARRGALAARALARWPVPGRGCEGGPGGRLRAGQSRSTQPPAIRCRRVPCTSPAWASSRSSTTWRATPTACRSRARSRTS